MVAGQLRHSSALHDTRDILELHRFLRQLGIPLKLLTETWRIGATESRFECLADLPRFLERRHVVWRRSKLIDPAIALRDRHVANLRDDFGAARGEGGDLDHVTLFARPLFRCPALAKPTLSFSASFQSMISLPASIISSQPMFII
jgi:hypothetical protein